jgi:hypothetical protein
MKNCPHDLCLTYHLLGEGPDASRIRLKVMVKIYLINNCRQAIHGQLLLQ